jgi:alpha-amylase/alpha-mannosidase (GH57 family)
MALAYALHYLESNHLAKLTNYGEFLENHPPSQQVKIFENTSWSCAHGVERWQSNCGCNSGGNPEWKQEWRGPLREALDWLRDNLAAVYEHRASELLKDPWRARNDYIEVISDRSTEKVEWFLEEQGVHNLRGAFQRRLGTTLLGIAGSGQKQYCRTQRRPIDL